MIGLVGKKLGMTRIFDKNGDAIPVTIIKINANRITRIKNISSDGYQSIQVTAGYKKSHRTKKPESGLFVKSGVKAGEGLWEFRFSGSTNLVVGQTIGLEIFKKIKTVDVTGFSTGKGFSGTIKRWNFRTQDATHGNSLSHRVPGSIGQNQTPGKVFKGKKMAGQLGRERVTIQNLGIIDIDTDQNILLVKGGVPGRPGGNLVIRPAVKG